MKMETGLDHAARPERGASAPAAVRWFRQVLLQLDRLSWGAIVVMMATMVVLVSAQVFCRYALSESIDWADEMSRLAFVWAIFLAIPQGIKQGVHVGIDIVIRLFNHKIQETLMRTMLGLSAVLMAVTFVQAISVAADSWGELMPTVDVTVSVFYIAVIVSSGHAFLHLVFMAWQGTDVWKEA